MPRVSTGHPNWSTVHIEEFRHLHNTLAQISNTGNHVEAALAQATTAKLSGSSSGVLFKGTSQAVGGVGADPRDLIQFVDLNTHAVRSQPQIEAALSRWESILQNYPPPKYISRSARAGSWGRARGMGTNRPNARPPPPWLAAQIWAFKNMLEALDDMAEDPVTHHIRRPVCETLAELTEPGGACLRDLPGLSEPDQLIQYSLGGPGAHPNDIRDMFFKYENDNLLTNPATVAYLNSLDPRRTHFKVAMDSPGFAARRSWRWLRELMPLYHALRAALTARLSGQPTARAPLVISRLQTLQTRMDALDGVVLPGQTQRWPFGAPGISPIDLRLLLTEASGGTMSRTGTEWHRRGVEYLAGVRTHWREIPDFIRHTGRGAHARDDNTIRPGDHGHD